MARGRAHSPEVRASVIAALLAGQGVNEIAAEYKIPKQVVSDWKNELLPEQIGQIRTEKKERLVDLIEAHLIASLKGAAKCAEQAFDDNWRTQQPADGLAVFYGVLSDKSIRLVEIAGRVFANDASASESP